MSGAAEYIKEFLASVGFEADEKSLKTALKAVTGFAVAVQAAGLAVLAGLTSVARGEADLARQAERLGTTTERIREMGYIAEQTGGSIDAVTSSLQSLVSKNPRIRDAAAALEEAGRRMQGMSDAQRRLYANRMGIDQSLIPMLTQDVGELRDEFAAMYATAGIDAQKAAAASKGLLAELGKLKTMAGLLAKSIAVELMDKVRRDIEQLRKVLVDNFDRIKRALQAVIALVLRISGVVSSFMYRAIAVFSAIMGWFERLDDGQQKLIIGIGLMAAAWKLFNSAFMATPVGKIVTGLTAIVALVDDYLTYMEGGQSFFDWGPFAESFERARKALAPIVEVLAAIFDGLATAVEPALTAVADNITGLVNILGDVGNLIVSIFSGDLPGVVDALASLVTNIFGTVNGAVEGAANTLRTLIGGIFDSLAERFPEFSAGFELASQTIQGIVTKLETVLGNVFDIIWSVGELVFSVFSGDFRQAADAAEKIIQGLGGIILTIFGDLVANVLGFFTGLWDDIKTAFPNFADVAQGAVDTIMGVFEGLWKWFIEKFDWIGKGFGRVASFFGFGDDTGDAAAVEGFPAGSMDMTNIIPDWYAPVAQAGQTTQQNNITSNTTINLEGISDPITAADLIEQRQDNQAQNIFRHLNIPAM